jgi:16S rRNA G966 N2-methylase RsmD
MNEKTRLFIERNLNADIRQLALQGSKDSEVDLPLALRQIAGRQTAHRKLPSWAALDGLLFPPHLNMEQCSSEQTARYKADICRRLLETHHDSPFTLHEPPVTLHPSPFTSLTDLTGGFGVDFSWMSKAFDEATYVERDSELFAISSHNFGLVNFVNSVKTLNMDGIDYLHQMNHPTIIFLDPARRDDKGARTYGIADCTPNVLEIKDELLQKADIVILKLSPMLDWRKAISDLGEQNVREVHIVSVQNECKELLLVLSASQPASPYTLFTINLLSDGTSQQFHVPSSVTFHPSCVPSVASEQSSSAPVTLHQSPVTLHQYLYEPNASIMKAGCFQELAQHYSVQPLAPNSHLFVSDQPIADFPGRSFQISAISSMNKKELKTVLSDIHSANITTRNFPLSVADLRKKLKLADGGNVYIFATTLANNQHVLIVCRVSEG